MCLRNGYVFVIESRAQGQKVPFSKIVVGLRSINVYQSPNDLLYILRRFMKVLNREINLYTSKRNNDLGQKSKYFQNSHEKLTRGTDSNGNAYPILYFILSTQIQRGATMQ